MFKLAILLCLFQTGLQLNGLAQSTITVSIDDLKSVKGRWQGTLTYLDYTSGKSYSMPANLIVSQEENSGTFLCRHEYPQEASANSVDTLLVSPDGKMINGRTIQSKRELPNGDLEIITEVLGKDGNENKAATIRTTYTIGKTMYSNKKDIRFGDAAEWIRRHEYLYTRIQ